MPTRVPYRGSPGCLARAAIHASVAPGRHEGRQGKGRGLTPSSTCPSSRRTGARSPRSEASPCSGHGLFHAAGNSTLRPEASPAAYRRHSMIIAGDLPSRCTPRSDAPTS
jgi:hypothetical protein